MPIDIDTQPVVIRVPRGAALPTSDVSSAEWTTLQGRVTVLEAGYDLGDLNDVDTSGVADGETIIYDIGTGTFVPGSSGGTVDTVRDSGGMEVHDVADIVATSGLKLAATSVDGLAYVVPDYGTATQTVAEGSHIHTQWVDSGLDIPASGTLSSGTRTLASGNVTGLQSDRAYVITATMRCDVRGEGAGAGTSTPSITINGNTSTRKAVRTVAGVDREFSWRHRGIAVSGVTSVAVSASLQFTSGDPMNVTGGDMTVQIKPYR